jgi:hypothetical protein
MKKQLVLIIIQSSMNLYRFRIKVYLLTDMYVKMTEMTGSEWKISDRKIIREGKVIHDRN